MKHYFTLDQVKSDTYGDYIFQIKVSNFLVDTSDPSLTIQATIRIEDCGSASVVIQGTELPNILVFSPRATANEVLRIPVTNYESSDQT